MKIKETIDRECCENKDLTNYKGAVSSETKVQRRYVKFCRHCGQCWEIVSREDLHGGPYLRRLEWKK